MIERKYRFDVFLSYAGAERATADVIRRSLSAEGLRVFDPTDAATGESIADAIWKALAKSDAIVVVLSSDEPPNPNTAAELGAAQAWHKPIYLVSNANGGTRIPTFLSGYRLYPVSRIDDVARAIKKGPPPLTPEEIERLQALYLEFNTPTDQLMKDPTALERLAERFNSGPKADISGERLMYEMLRLRKLGNWPRLGRNRLSKPRT
jgi:hypothetical protein